MLLDLRPYPVKLTDAGRCSACGSLIPDRYDEYDVKKSLTTLLFNDQIQLGDEDLVKHEALAGRIKEAEFEIELTEDEIKILKDTVSSFKGYTSMDIGLIKRIHDLNEKVSKMP
jgi:hypothetical protein